MWNALRKKVNKSSRSYQLTSNHTQSDSEDSDAGGGGATTKVVLKRYMKISSCSEGLDDAETTSADPDPVAPRRENPYASLDARAVPATGTSTDGWRADAVGWSTVDNARHLLLSSDTAAPRDTIDLRNNNSTHDDVMRRLDDVITADPDGNANHFGAEVPPGRVSPPRLKRREKTPTSSAVVRKQPNGDDQGPVTSQPDYTGNDVTDASSPTMQSCRGPEVGHVVVPESSTTLLTADDEESGYSTLRDILGQVQKAMMEQQHQQQQQQQQVQLINQSINLFSNIKTAQHDRNHRYR